MCRHKGNGMNKPKKKKVPVPKFFAVRLQLRGLEPEPVADVDLDGAGPPAAQPPPSPCKQLVKDIEQKAWLLEQEAAEACAAVTKAKADYEIAYKVHDACERALSKAKPSTSFTVLDNRERKLRKVEMEKVWSMHALEAAKADSFKAHFKAAQMRGFAKDATIARLKINNHVSAGKKSLTLCGQCVDSDCDCGIF